MYYFLLFVEVTCPDLPDITNGVITYNMPAPRPVDTTATYVCEEGFALVGNSVRNCQEDKTFSGEDPFCSMIRKCVCGGMGVGVNVSVGIRS